MTRVLVNFIGLAVTWGVWLWLAGQDFAQETSLFIAMAGVLALIPAILFGRPLLDHQSNLQRAELITTVMHYLFATLFGSALLAAVQSVLKSPAWPIPLPPWLGFGLMLVSGLLLLAVTINLVYKGLGSPLALGLTRLVVTDWIYAWTRNPLVLSALLFLVGLGLWFQSGLFLVWVLVVVCPTILVFLKVYEERELEIRFGQAYREYRSRTPMIVPRRPPKRPLNRPND